MAFDVGWPDTFAEYRTAVKQAGLDFKMIKHFMVSHFHLDHAGLAGMLMKNGLSFYVFENQVSQIAEMEELIKKKYVNYCEIAKDKIKTLKLAESRNWLRSIGVEGEVVQVFGHGNESVVLLLDSGEALIGDLPVFEDYDDLVKMDWLKLKSMKVRKIFPAHAAGFEVV
ncbi:MAG: hypothetical protein KBC53_12155 [Nitrosomonas sp.]|nr:hypothetical protein [Nitrosomonas sp.]